MTLYCGFGGSKTIKIGGMKRMENGVNKGAGGKMLLR